MVDSFRPVSVLPVLVKVFERLLHQQMYSYLQEHSILHAAQSGFRPRYTTHDVLVSMVNDWKSIFPSSLALKLALFKAEGRRHRIETMKTGMGVLTDQKSIADEFNRYFSSLVGAVESPSHTTLSIAQRTPHGTHGCQQNF